MNMTMKMAMTAISVAIIMSCSTPRNSVSSARKSAPRLAMLPSSDSAERTMEDVRNTPAPKPRASTPNTTTATS